MKLSGAPMKKAHSNLFFIELIIVLLFFSVSGAVVLGMFAQADSLEHKTSLAERAIIEVQSIAEIYSHSGDIDKALDTVFGRGYSITIQENRHFVCLDEDMHPLMTPEARVNYGRLFIRAYETRTKGECGELCELEIRIMFTDDTEFYSQKSSVYIPDTAGGDAA